MSSRVGFRNMQVPSQIRLPNKTVHTWCLNEHFMGNVTVWFGAQEDVMTSVLQLYFSVQNSLKWSGNGAECINKLPSRFIWISITSGTYLHPTHFVRDCTIDGQTEWLTLNLLLLHLERKLQVLFCAIGRLDEDLLYFITLTSRSDSYGSEFQYFPTILKLYVFYTHSCLDAFKIEM
jgi:hypothetical protein